MKTKIVPCLLLVLASSFVSGQEVRKADVARPTAPGETFEEIQKPVPFTDTELRVLRSASSLSTERLLELLVVYEKVENTAMMDALARAILRREPTHPDASRIQGLVDPEMETRHFGYLDEISKQVMAGKKVEDTDSVAVQASALANEGNPGLAVQLLEALRRNQYDKTSFPYLDDLAFAYNEAGMLDQAIKASEAILTEGGFSSESRIEAQKLLPSLRMRKRIAGISREAGTDMDRLVALAEKLYREKPTDHDVIAFRIESLDRARRYEDAVSFLEGMKKKAPRGKVWPYQITLAFAYFGARRHEDAITAFRELQKTPGIDAATRAEAENMILEIRVGREIELGMAAMKRGDMAKADAVLRTLERDYKLHPDTLGYRAILLAKRGKFQEAHEILQAAKAEATKVGLPFSQQDAIADVYLEQKNYIAAIGATREILEHPLYDEEMKRQAELKLHEIGVMQTLEAGYAALQDGYRSRARAILEKLQRSAPESLEVKIFQAEVALAYNQAATALDQITTLKSTSTEVPFPGQGTLGSALFATGDWEAAFDAYTEILDQPGFDPRDRSEAILQRRLLRPLFRPTLDVSTDIANEEEGDTYSSQATVSSGWMNDWRFVAFTHHDYVKLAPGFFNVTDANRVDGGLSVQRRFNGRYFAEVTAGASQSEMIYGARIGRYGNQGLAMSLGFMANQRSTESPSVQALDGRENRAEFEIIGPIGDRWLVDFTAYYRQLEIGGDSLGTGFGYEGSLDYVLITQTPTRAQVTIGYYGQYQRFDSVRTVPPSVRKQIRRAVVPQEQVRGALASNEEVRRAVPGSFGQEVLDQLVDPEANRQGVRLTIRKRIGDDWTVYAQVGGYYAFDDKRFDYTAAAGVEYYLSDDALIYAEVRYDSNGRTTSAGVLGANIGALVSF